LKEDHLKTITVQNDDIERAKNAAIVECAELYNNENERDALRQFKEKWMPPDRIDWIGTDIMHPQTIKHKHDLITKAKRRRLFIERVSIAWLGGLVLIAPMLMMTFLAKSVSQQLVTTSVFVFIVAFSLAWIMEDAQYKEIFGAVAAYAAVLVVFVGSGTTVSVKGL
jgi:hypothetical protein